MVMRRSLAGLLLVLVLAGAARAQEQPLVAALSRTDIEVTTGFTGASLVVFGSTVVLKLVERFPVIIQGGAAVLAFTAAKMIVGEPLLDAVFDPHAAARFATYALAIAGVLAAGRWAARRDARMQA